MTTSTSTSEVRFHLSEEDHHRLRILAAKANLTIGRYVRQQMEQALSRAGTPASPATPGQESPEAR